eukprot:TRINITY_DN17759_c0_g1_i1.p1 TRINITY_DN17759_c0_g1~~TRINITY_DN17759_c0_g1_i1.p1  ORF type:complete len:479 (+),score=65.04 TRINITY_DN17759_c0_g1_i1:179-1438(+)
MKMQGNQGRLMLQREIAMMKELRHENVLQLYDVMETQKHFYLVLEFASGGELFDLIQENQRFIEKTARNYYQQLILGIKYCHAQGIVHRDLKPQNLLLTADGVLKIADFGFSNIQNLDDGQVTPTLRLQTQCGTPNYAAPEIFLNKGYNGFQTDVWSCGVILYVMLVGYAPFKPQGGVRGIQGVIQSIIAGRYTIPDHVSPDASDLITRILVGNPDKRLTIKEIMDHIWFLPNLDNSKLFEVPKIVISEDAVRQSIRVEAGERDVEKEDKDLLCTGNLDGCSSNESEGSSSPSRSPTTEPIQLPASLDLDGCDHLGRVLGSVRKTGSAASLLATSVTTRSRSPGGPPPDSGFRTGTPHVFSRKHWHSPHWCFICKKFIYGVGRQGFSCVNCLCPVHIKCVEAATDKSCCEFYRESKKKK